MIIISDYIRDVPLYIPVIEPWNLCQKSESIVFSLIEQLTDDYKISNGVAQHRTATVEIGAILKSPVIIGPNCFVASYAYLRGGVFLESNVIIGPSTEVKSSFMFEGSKAAHLNFIGDSVIGRNVNIEAGAVLANYRNELESKEIICIKNGQSIKTHVDKFGSIVGDRCKIGANAVLAPGTVLNSDTIVKRLALIDQTVL